MDTKLQDTAQRLRGAARAAKSETMRDFYSKNAALLESLAKDVSWLNRKGEDAAKLKRRWE